MDFRSGLILRLILVLVPTAVQPTSAQGADRPQEEPASAPPAHLVTGQEGFALESGDGDYRLQIGLLAHVDGRFAAADEGDAIDDTFAIRRMRPYLRGRVLRRFEFYLNPDFAGGTFVLQDAYVDTIVSPALRVRAGKAKTPFGMERLHSASQLLFIERALPTALAPNRDIGVQVLGDIHGGVMSYLAGVMNGVTDGGSADRETAGDGKDVSARVVWRPFARRTASALRGFGVAVSGSAGRAAGAAQLPTLRTQTIQQTYFTYAAGAAAAGTRTRYSPQIFFFRRQFGGWVEYVRTETPVTRGGATATIAHAAWQAAASWVVTGETASEAGGGVRPNALFDPPAGRWGAFQVAARVHQLQVDQRAIAHGFAAADASRKAQAWTLGLNWYPSGNMRYMLNVERTVFDGRAVGARPPENGIAFRTQLNF